METVTKRDLIEKVADETKQKRVDVKRTVQSLLDQMIRELGAGNRVEFRDFGVFEPRERAPRVAQNPRTLERIQVPAKKVVKFKVGRLMQLSVEDPAAAMDELAASRVADVVVRTDGNGRAHVGPSGRRG